MLKEVQVPPGQGIGVVGLTADCLADRTRKHAAARKIEMDVQTPNCLIERAVIDLPWRRQPQGYLKQFIFIHAHAIIARRPDWGFAPNPRIYRLRPEWPFPIPCPGCRPLQSDYPAGRQGNAGMRPERHAGSGVDGGLRAASRSTIPNPLPTLNSEEAFVVATSKRCRTV